MLPLRGRSALVTGVSRRRGIGFAVATRLAELGANVLIHHYSPHDAEQPWGADDLDQVRDGIRSALAPGALLDDVSADLADPTAPRALIDAGVRAFGRLEILVCNHARSGSDGSIFEMTANLLDGHWQVNARSTLLLTRFFAEQFSGHAAGDSRTGATAPASRTAPTAPTAPGLRQVNAGPHNELTSGRVFWLTSGQHEGPMLGEVAYATSKAALAGITPTVASELLTRGILLNTINPGPVNTGYLDPETTDRPLDAMQEHLKGTAFGRFGLPTDPARLIGWLATDEGRWIVGQVLTSDGGFRL